MRAQGLWNSREEGKWVALEASKMNREQGIRLVVVSAAFYARTAANYLKFFSNVVYGPDSCTGPASYLSSR